MEIREGNYLNGYKIVRITPDPFNKGQINLWTDEDEADWIGNKSTIKFTLNPDKPSFKFRLELVDRRYYNFYKWLENESHEVYRDCGHRQNTINEVLNKFREFMREE